MQLEEGKTYISRDGGIIVGPMRKTVSFEQWMLDRYPLTCSQSNMPCRADGLWRQWPSEEPHEWDLVAEVEPALTAR